MLARRAAELLLQLHVSVAFPVNVGSLAAVALMVTGVTTAAVHVAVTWIAGEAERWIEGSLTVQLELTCVAVFTAIHWGLPVARLEALKVVLLAGAAAVWSTVADPGATLNDVVQLDEEVPPQPAIANNAAQNRTDATILHGNISYLPFIVEQKKTLYHTSATGQRCSRTVKTGRLNFLTFLMEK